MPDQFKYLAVAQRLRGSAEFVQFFNSPVELAGLFFAFSPIPVINSIFDLAVFNRFAISLFIIFASYYFRIRRKYLALLILFPSGLLYSSLALRDTLICLIMSVSFLFLIHKRFLGSAIMLAPLAILKLQNFLVMATYFCLRAVSGSFTGRRHSVIVVAYFLCFFVSLLMVSDEVDRIRRALFLEDGGDVDEYVAISSALTLAQHLAISPIKFLLEPTVVQATNFFQLIQSVENIVVIAVLFLLFRKAFSVDREVSLQILAFLVAGLALYGLVVFNFGTGVRYKFPFIFTVLIGLICVIEARRSE
jgi:hypothetical protein